MTWSSCLPLEKQPNRDRWEEEQRRAGAFGVERAAALFWEGSSELCCKQRWKLLCRVLQRSHSGLLLLKKLTYTEQHLGSALAQEEESNNNSVRREQSDQSQPLACTRAACLRLEARFLIAFLQGNSCCKIFHSCRDYMCRRCCHSWEEEGRQMF